jgi:hypothetical protein
VAGSGGAIHDPGGATGAAGEGPEPTACTFLYLGDWQRCEGDDTDHWVERVPNKSLTDCELACLQDPQCTAVVDYYWLDNPNLRECVLSVGSCDHPSQLIWAQEDAGKEYRKVCN